MSLSPLKTAVEVEKTATESSGDNVTGVNTNGGLLSILSSDMISSKLRNKAEDGRQHLDMPPDSAFRNSVDTLSDISTYSADNDNERRSARSLLNGSNGRVQSRSPAPPRTWRGRCALVWARYKGVALVISSQFFGALMNVTTRLLEINGSHGKGMHPFQVCWVPRNHQ